MISNAEQTYRNMPFFFSDCSNAQYGNTSTNISLKTACKNELYFISLRQMLRFLYIDQHKAVAPTRNLGDVKMLRMKCLTIILTTIFFTIFEKIWENYIATKLHFERYRACLVFYLRRHSPQIA